MATVNTSWVSPAGATLDKATGNTIDEAMTDAWSSDLYHLGGTQGYIGVRAQTSGAQSIANATLTALAFPAEQFAHDPNGTLHHVSGSPVPAEVVTCRTAGVYRLAGHARFAVNATGYRQISLRVNGTLYLATSTATAVTGITTDLAVADDYFLAATDYVELVATQTSGGALDVDSAALSVVKA